MEAKEQIKKMTHSFCEWEKKKELNILLSAHFVNSGKIFGYKDELSRGRVLEKQMSDFEKENM